MVLGEGNQAGDPMSDHASSRVGSAPVVNLTALDRWMQDHVASYRGPLSIEQFRGGQSNPTFALSTPRGGYVLRRKPNGPLLKGAHAVEREARVISALFETGFPVPRVYGLCEDETVIGAPFFVMQLMKGRIFWDATFPEVSDEQRSRYFDAMNATIARLHRLDFLALGLGDFGVQGHYMERQITRWSKQYLEDEAAGRNPDMDRLVEWLPRHIPADDESSLVHGDFRCDNLMFDATNPDIVAVLDWELSTLGHPLADFAYHLMMYRVPPGVSPAWSARILKHCVSLMKQITSPHTASELVARASPTSTFISPSICSASPRSCMASAAECCAEPRCPARRAICAPSFQHSPLGLGRLLELASWPILIRSPSAPHASPPGGVSFAGLCTYLRSMALSITFTNRSNGTSRWPARSAPPPGSAISNLDCVTLKEPNSPI